jgi:hypothetical protein
MLRLLPRAQSRATEWTLSPVTHCRVRCRHNDAVLGGADIWSQILQRIHPDGCCNKVAWLPLSSKGTFPYSTD